MDDRRNRKRRQAGSSGPPSRPHGLEPVPGLVLDGPFAETKERVLGLVTRRAVEAALLDRPSSTGAARSDAS